MEKINSLTGMADLIGHKDKKSNQSDSIFQVEKKLIEIFENYSLQEIRTPALESEKLFNRSVGDLSDIVNKELYTFKDKNEKSISLRPEGTAGVVRSIIEKKLDNESHRFWYLGPMWRYERPQKGRYRQFYQAGVELIGYEEGLSELEMISLVISINSELNINDSIIKINHLGDKKAKEGFCQSLKEYLEPYKSELDEKDIDRLSKNPLRILDSKNSNTQKILKNAPKISDFISDEASNLLNTIKNTYPQNHIEIDHSLVRGLDYYTGFVFEAVSEHLGAQDSYLGGGRYGPLKSRAFTFGEVQPQTQRIGHGQNIGEQNSRVHRVPSQRLQRNFAGQFGVGAEPHKTARLGAGLAIFGEVPPRLTHHP